MKRREFLSRAITATVAGATLRTSLRVQAQTGGAAVSGKFKQANHGGVFLRYCDQAYALCQAMGSPPSGREFVIGMEHGNAKSGKASELAVIRAYGETDAFATL